MELIKQQMLTGERALFNSKDLQISYCTFADGESPLKESQNIKIDYSTFKWKYPLWYCKNIVVEDSTLFEMARSGIWYTENIDISNTIIEAPKNFRRSKGITLENVTMPNADETLWNCDNILFKDVTAKGDYFGMNSSNIKIDGFELVGNYSFDGGKNIEIHNAKMLSKDAFWNCENVTVYDSFISGEYLGWNSKNVTLVNCTIESLQGMCYMDNLVMKNCRLLNTTLAFEYSTIDVQIINKIDSVMNPISGIIRAESISELIMDETKINPKKTQIITEGMKHAI
ncbi:DUF3737 family protein [Clostridium beijerinckii]|uniref:DUF3737 family protein n=1 Tax=Clostridium beijerinckii TaxID=1520 RepID=UPI00047EB4CD|nr:DUF3737 family protein [Clostridium beijerinckii]